MAPASLFPYISVRKKWPMPPFCAPAAALWLPWILEAGRGRRAPQLTKETQREIDRRVAEIIPNNWRKYPDSCDFQGRQTSNLNAKPLRASPGIGHHRVPADRELDAKVCVAVDVAEIEPAEALLDHEDARVLPVSYAVGRFKSVKRGGQSQVSDRRCTRSRKNLRAAP